MSMRTCASLWQAHADLDVRLVTHNWPASSCESADACWLAKDATPPSGWKTCKTTNPVDSQWDGTDVGLIAGMGGWSDSYVHMG